MALNSLPIKTSYRSGKDNFARDFFIPALAESIVYDRAVGYFSSSCLLDVMTGLYKFFENGGKIRLIASPYLTKEDFEAIEAGYEARLDIVKKALFKSLKPANNDTESERLNLLAHLIAQERLDIRIALIKDGRGLYHEKIGVMADDLGNRLAFTGSLNETGAAFADNYESIDVYCSWNGGTDAIRVDDKQTAFEEIWNNEAPKLAIHKFEDLDKELVRQYLRDHAPVNTDITPSEMNASVNTERGVDGVPENIRLRPYQVEAIRQFMKHDGRGIFDMATGTGKTFTALGAISCLREHLHGKLGVIIVAPYQHLVEQWVDDIRAFGISPIVAYSKSAQKTWKTDFKRVLTNLRLGIGNKPFFCIITTNATFRGKAFQTVLWDKYHEQNLMLVVDEAHNFGASGLQKTLDERFNYRLALSATLSRHNDEEGTAVLRQFFEHTCISYDLEMAIREGMLTPYEYHPIFVSLTEDEREQYKILTSQIGSYLCTASGKSKKKIPEAAKHLLIERSRLIANAENKLHALASAIEPYINDKHILVYCGTTAEGSTVSDIPPVFVEDETIKQIDAVARMLTEKGMRVAKFTSEADIEQRQVLTQSFAQGIGTQALIAIKCLDEGVSIPSIKTAFILASTTNPKEYIQRRGRVLRLAKGKEKAVIYDFITLPFDFEEASCLPPESLKPFRSLAINEAARFFEFMRLSENKLYVEPDYNELSLRFQIQPSEIDHVGDRR